MTIETDSSLNEEEIFTHCQALFNRLNETEMEYFDANPNIIQDSDKGLISQRASEIYLHGCIGASIIMQVQERVAQAKAQGLTLEEVQRKDSSYVRNILQDTHKIVGEIAERLPDGVQNILSSFIEGQQEKLNANP